MTNVVEAQAIYCSWSKGKADSFCIGLLLLHLICSQDNKENGSDRLWGVSCHFPSLLHDCKRDHFIPTCDLITTKQIALWGNANGTSRRDRLTLVFLMFLLPAGIWIQGTTMLRKQSKKFNKPLPYAYVA